MSSNFIFCTSCGHGAAVDARFCEDCGSVFESVSSATLERKLQTLSLDPAKRAEALSKARSMVSTWVMPFNATLVFGTTLIGIFDFLSPRIALLPIAATVAVVGLLTALSLRKFVAPSLPIGSAFRRALAPEMGLLRSPILVSTGLLSALMVCGAAWSSAESSSGGVIAGKFDAARNAQMQLGVMQSLQKEQRVQTSVLEDIREGRTLNPRRELANQGILWTKSAFSSALESGDKSVVALFLDGGMQWRLIDVLAAKKNSFEDIFNLLLSHPKLRERREYNDCNATVSALTDKKVNSVKYHLQRESQKVSRLDGWEVRVLKTFCSTPTDVSDLEKRLTTAIQKYETEAATIKSTYLAIGPAPGTVRTLDECRADLSAGNGKEIRSALSNFIPTKGRPSKSYPFDIYFYQGEILLNRAKANGGFVLDARGKSEIEAFCQSHEGQNSNVDDFEIQRLRLVVDALG